LFSYIDFFGCISTITPPVALASYVAAGIANANINKLSWTAFRFGLTSFVLPYMFFWGPALLLQGFWWEIQPKKNTNMCAVSRGTPSFTSAGATTVAKTR